MIREKVFKVIWETEMENKVAMTELTRSKDLTRSRVTDFSNDSDSDDLSLNSIEQINPAFKI